MDPIKPGEVHAKRVSEHHTEYKNVVDRINKALIERGSGTTFQADLIPEILKPAVVRNFRKAGWDVTLVSDPRDGDFYTFTEAHPTRKVNLDSSSEGG